jgi:MFS family permease
MVVGEDVPQRGRSRFQGTSLDAFSHRDFALFWWAALVSNSASWMQIIAVPAVLWNMTHSATLLGLASFAGMGPSLVLTPFAGVLADRVPRRTILIVTQAVALVAALGLWILYHLDELTPGRILLLLLVNGMASAFQISAWQAFIPTLVPRPLLLDAVRMNSVQFTASRAIGPGLGALLLSRLGIGLAFLSNAGTFLLVIAALLIVRPSQVITVRKGDPMLPSLFEGFRYVMQRQPLRHIVILTFWVAACGQSLMGLAPGIADEIYGRGTQGQATLITALGVGAIISSIYVIGRGNRARRSQTLRLAFVSYIIGVALVGATHSFYVGLVAFFLGGGSHIATAVSMNTYLQAYVDDERRGRVISVYLLSVTSGLPFGALVLGKLGDLFSLRTAFLGNTVVYLGIVLYTALRWKGYRELDTPPDDYVGEGSLDEEKARPSRVGGVVEAIVILKDAATS